MPLPRIHLTRSDAATAASEPARLSAAVTAAAGKGRGRLDGEGSVAGNCRDVVGSGDGDWTLGGWEEDTEWAEIIEEGWDLDAVNQAVQEAMIEVIWGM